MESGFMSLPMDVFHLILDEVVTALKIKKALRLRLVNKKLATEILYTVCKPGSIDVTREAIFDNYWRLHSMSKVVIVGFLLPRLNLSYAVQSHYLSTILKAEELLMRQYPNQTEKQRQEFRYALCTAETWTWPLRDVVLGDIEPIFPQKKPPVDDTSPLADALSAAAYMGHLDLVQKLIRKGADLNLNPGYLRPPLQQAASRGHNDILLLLLSEGADINIGHWRPIDSDDCGALHFASLHGHESTVKLLRGRMDHHRSGDIVFPALEGGHLNLIKMYMETEISAYIKNEPRASLRMLLYAVYHDHEHIVRWLLQNGADITKNNHTYSWDLDRTPLDIAALHGRAPTVRLLLEYGTNRHVPALANAAQNGHVEVAKLLLDTPGEDVDICLMLHGERPFRKRRKSYQTPLRLAAQNGEVEMVRFLLSRGLKRHFPVSEAVNRGEEEILRLLLETQVRLGIEKDYSYLLPPKAKQRPPKRISNLLLDLSPTTRAAVKVASSGPAE